jgi:ribosomal protein L11 methyltransferase
MPWIQIFINTIKNNVDEISDLLFDVGCLSVTYTNAGDAPVFELKPGDINYWQDTTVVGLFDAAVDTDLITTFLQGQPIFAAGLNHRFEQVEDKDWEREWMDNFHPMQFGQRLWICPSWRDVPNPNACNVMLDPGLAFGTGTHETTALCLEWLESIDLTGKTVVDFGCGSGILAIAALKLGASHAIGIDIDPKAITASKENAERNDVAGLAEWHLLDNAPTCNADIVVANILAGPLIALKQLVCSYANINGAVVLSGILEEQVESVEAEYAELLTLDTSSQKGQWMRVSGTPLAGC